MSNVPSGVYPLSTAQSLAIPYDVAAPRSMVRAAALSSSDSAIILPEDSNLCSVYFTADTLLFIGTPIAVTTNVVTPGCYFCKAGVTAELLLPKNITIRGVSEDSQGYINILVPWVQMNNTAQYGVS